MPAIKCSKKTLKGNLNNSFPQSSKPNLLSESKEPPIVNTTKRDKEIIIFLAILSMKKRLIHDLKIFRINPNMLNTPHTLPK